jgi:hypothetical protein
MIYLLQIDLNKIRFDRRAVKATSFRKTIGISGRASDQQPEHQGAWAKNVPLRQKLLCESITAESRAPFLLTIFAYKKAWISHSEMVCLILSPTMWD